MPFIKKSRGKTDREELCRALKATQRGNKFVVYKLDCLAKSIKQLYQLSDELHEKGDEFINIQDNIYLPVERYSVDGPILVVKRSIKFVFYSSKKKALRTLRN